MSPLLRATPSHHHITHAGTTETRFCESDNPGIFPPIGLGGQEPVNAISSLCLCVYAIKFVHDAQRVGRPVTPSK